MEAQTWEAIPTEKRGHEKMTIMAQKKWQNREGVLKLIWLYVTLIISKFERI